MKQPTPYKPSASGKNLLANGIGCIAAIFIVPVFLIVKLVMMPFEKPFNRTPEEVVGYLRGFLEETGGPWDWDDFTSIPIADPRLEDIRQRVSALDLPMSDADVGPLTELIAEAEAIAAGADVESNR